jgi:hypothetical protein
VAAAPLEAVDETNLCRLFGRLPCAEEVEEAMAERGRTAGVTTLVLPLRLREVELPGTKPVLMLLLWLVVDVVVEVPVGVVARAGTEPLRAAPGRPGRALFSCSCWLIVSLSAWSMLSP